MMILTLAVHRKGENLENSNILFQRENCYFLNFEKTISFWASKLLLFSIYILVKTVSFLISQKYPILARKLLLFLYEMRFFVTELNFVQRGIFFLFWGGFKKWISSRQLLCQKGPFQLYPIFAPFDLSPEKGYRVVRKRQGENKKEVQQRAIKMQILLFKVIKIQPTVSLFFFFYPRFA